MRNLTWPYSSSLPRPSKAQCDVVVVDVSNESWVGVPGATKDPPFWWGRAMLVKSAEAQSPHVFVMGHLR
ncbi:hypothetical protein TNCV_404111 [Trichonephila clavipes]|nr:hypothetical protein TNCV_404111 [Trichonephila clavipes]